MSNVDALVGNPRHDNSRYAFAKPGELYLVYLANGGAAELEATSDSGQAFSLAWFNPREGGALRNAADVRGGGRISLTAPSSDDWLAVLRRK